MRIDFTLPLLIVLTFVSCVGFLSEQAKGDVQVLNLELKRMPFQRDYFFPGVETWGHEVTLNLRATEGWFFLESDLTGQTSNSRFRNMWWDYTVGAKIFPFLDIVWDHRSQHALDWDRESFPVRDSLGVRLNFIGGR